MIREFRIYITISFLTLFSLLAPAQAQSNLFENFDSWPLDFHENWKTNTINGWTLHDGLIKVAFGGFGDPITVACAWLPDDSISSNAWLRSPFLPYGIGAFSFWIRGNTGETNENFFEIQHSGDATNWLTDQVYRTLGQTWEEIGLEMNILTPVYVRILKISDTGPNQFLGIEDVTATQPGGVILTDLLITPDSPTIEDSVTFHVNVQTGPNASNAVMTAYYRIGDSEGFTAIPMSFSSGSTYASDTPVPSGHSGVIQYYVEAIYDGVGPDVFLPPGGALAPASYDTDNPFLSATLRQLEPSSRRTGLIISEIMYHPQNRLGTNSLEYVELFNANPIDMDLTGHRLSGEIDYVFPSNTTMAARSFIVIARSPSAINSLYGPGNVLGPYSGNLPNGGRLRLRNRTDAILLNVEYESRLPWPISADGAGHSLVLASPDYGEGNPAAWSASTFIGGSPGTLDPDDDSPLDNIVINEFLAHTDPNVDAIELYNPEFFTVDLSGCWLSDRPQTNLYRIPTNTLIAPGAFFSVVETNLGFQLNASGDDIFLVNSQETRVIDAVRFEAQQNSVSSGRFPDGAPEFHELTESTIGSANSNSALRIRDVVINEIMYHPISGDRGDEYVELYNRSTGTVDISRWKLDGGIRYTFPANTQIPAESYLVVARNAERLIARYPQLEAANTFGDFSGQLSNSGENIMLRKPDDPGLPFIDLVVVDEVTYGEGDRWGQWTDGGGSSLELIDPRSDNRRAMNWAGSDESQKTLNSWTLVEHTGTLDHGNAGFSPNEIQVLLLNAGECLVDDIEIQLNNGPNLLSQGTFEAGLGSWVIQGNHTESSLASEGYESSQSLRLRASDDGDNGANRVEVDFSGLSPGNTNVTIRARARWVAGHRGLLLRFLGNWLEASAALEIPEDLGTPGLQNSRFSSNAAPAVWDVSHTPTLPVANSNVVVSARVHDPDGISSVSLQYRIDPSATVNTLAMNDTGQDGDVAAGDGAYSATLPGQAGGTIIAFRVEAADAHSSSLTNRFPTSEGLVIFGQTPLAGTLGSYRILLTEAARVIWAAQPRTSGHMADCTVIYNQYRAIYDAGARSRGSPFIRRIGDPLSGSGAYAMRLPKDDRLFGARAFNLDGLEFGRDNTYQREWISFWIADQLDIPFSYQRYVHIYLNTGHKGVIYTDSHFPNGDYLSKWFPDDDEGELFEIDDWFEFNDGFGFNNVNATMGNFITDNGAKKQARYRWSWEKRPVDADDDSYQSIFSVADAFAQPLGDVYDARVSALVDYENWMRTFAVRHIVADWDGYSYSRGKNTYTYNPTRTGYKMLLWDLDFSLGAGSQGTGANLFSIGDPALSGKFFVHPRFRRAYWRALQDAVDGPLLAGNAAQALDANFDAFQRNGVSVADPSGAKTWIGDRRTYIISQLGSLTSTPFAITTGDFTTGTFPTPINGNAAVEVAEIRVNDALHKVNWTGETTWQLSLGLVPGSNTLHVTAFNLDGQQVGEDDITVIYTGTTPAPTGQLIITEIMYHAPIPGGDYLEIHNRSATETFDLAGWRINGVGHVFEGGTFIQPGEYGVIADSASLYAETHVNAERLLGQYPGDLDDGGETISLQMPLGSNEWITIDTVTYDNKPPWPSAADGLGQALQIIDINADNNRVGNWGPKDAISTNEWMFRSTTGTVSSNPFLQLAAQLNVFAEDPGDIFLDRICLVTGIVPEAGDNLLENGDFESPFSSPWSAIGNHAGSGIVTSPVFQGVGSLKIAATGPGDISANLIKQPQDLFGRGGQVMTLSYWYHEELIENDITVIMEPVGEGLHHSIAVPPPSTDGFTSPGAVNSNAHTLFEFPLLWINEVMPFNTSFVTDNMGEFEPWIELYNADTTPILLDDYRLSNLYTDPGKWAFPTGITLSAGERLLVWADGETGESAPNSLHTSFELHNVSGSVVLARIHFGEPVIIDYLDYSGVGENASYGFFPDGQSGNRQMFPTPTPAAANSLTSPPIQVVINEWMSDNDATLQDPTDGKYEDWFELFNPSLLPVSLGGYFLTDDLSVTQQFTMPGGTIIPSESHMLVWADNDDEENGPGIDLHVNFGLSKDGEALALFAPDGTLVDSVIFGAQSTDVTHGRWPDGESAIYQLSTPTPGDTNSLFAVIGISSLDPGGFSFDTAAEVGSVYCIEGSENLLNTNWFLIDVVTAQTAILSYTDTNAPGLPLRFYRVIDKP